jgi:hypothetical protein
MFVRWQKRKRKSRAFGGGRRGTDTHWAASLVESVRVDGKPTQRHVAYLAGITDSGIEIAAQRAFFWQKATEQLDRLANRISKDDRARIEDLIEKRVPRLTRKEYDDCLARWAALGLDEYPFRQLPSFMICERKGA